MLNLNLNLKLNELGDDPFDTAEVSAIDTPEGIAVIGVDAKAGSALTREEIWNAFALGLDMVTPLPEERKADAQSFAQVAYRRRIKEFSERAYLPWIDKFDPGVFKLSPTEAEVMDPVQRMYLESAWTALEDAGYGGSKLYGSKTGVYVGYNNVGQGYDALLEDAPEETLGITVSGNIGSFLASRLSYLLNLTGPAMVIDTACSSSLVALHQACRALRSKEISMAVVGTIRIFFCPERTGEDMGTTSSSERTKTFDEAADGTGGGEGVINLILKPLGAAVEDGDHIYAVIKGSCANQDGSSIGITAPNSAAQENAIVEAWNEAGIDPEKISYMEAHGTATKLGDPVEIGGLTGAFERFTEKKQFCAIGAAKSNFGHLDCASGLLGVVKVLLMMEHRMIPPSVHFQSPNRKIDYINSPVYINDRAKPWVTEDGVLTAGVSSFGLSGTNCHVVLQSYDAPKTERIQTSGQHLITASARERETLQTLLLSYQDYLRTHPETDLTDFCYSVNMGRELHRCRFAMVVDHEDAFLRLTPEELVSHERCREFHIVAAGRDTQEGLLTRETQETLTQRAREACAEKNLSQLAELYLKGAETDLSPLYEKVQRISVPTYPFRYRRYWYTPPKKATPNPDAMHPLVDRLCADSCDLRIYERVISPENCMELREHRINGVCVLPGTVYVEIAHAVGKDIFGSADFSFTNITFLSLLTCQEGEARTLHAIAELAGRELKLRMASRGKDGVWINHIEGTLCREAKPREDQRIDLQALLGSYAEILTQQAESEEDFVQLGEHWQTGRQLYRNPDSVILYSEVPEKYVAEAERYYFYPPLLDGSMNSGIVLLDGQYLPLNYKNVRFYHPLCGKTFSRITRKPMTEGLGEIALFRVEMYDDKGILIGEIEEYALKRVNESEQFLRTDTPFHQISWEPEDAPQLPNEKSPCAVVLLTKGQEATALVTAIQDAYDKTVLLYLSEETKRISATVFHVRNREEDLTQVLREVSDRKDVTLINLLAFAPDPEELSEGIETKLHGTFSLAKALCGIAGEKTLNVVVQEAGCITGREGAYHPLNQAVIGLCSCLEAEQSDMEVCVLDADLATDPRKLIAEIKGPHNKMVVGYRENCRYVEKLSSLQKREKAISLSDGDTVVIAGGFGGIGLAVSEALFERYPKLRIVLTSRKGIVPSEDERTARLKKLQAAGCQIEVVQADVSDREQVSRALEQVRASYGRIDMVILAAGIAGDGMLAGKPWDHAMQVLKPKLFGARNLDLETREDPLKCFLLFSSFTSAIGAAGQTDYTAANAYLDAFTHERNRQGRRTMTINWTGWKDSGMARNYQVDWQNSIVRFVSDEEGKRLFADALEFGAHRILVCELRKEIPEIWRLQRRLALPKGVVEMDEDVALLTTEYDSPVIYGKSPDKLTDVEKQIATAWARTLHVTEVNIYDKFFEAGGNSLLASYLQKEINRIYPDAMAITEVFVYSTIYDIAAYISGKLGIDAPQQEKTADTADLEDLVQQFMSGNLSLEEMENLV